MICFLFDVFYLLLGILLLPWILYRRVWRKRYQFGWGQRFGAVPYRKSSAPCIWIHAVSMGEINAIGSLLEEFQRELPDYECVISTTTDTGYQRARQIYGKSHTVFFFPLDFSWAVKKAFGRIRPRVCVLMELEVWPNFTAVARELDIPLVVANGRISSGKGFPRYRRIAPLVRPIFRRLGLVLVQEDVYAKRFTFLGVPGERVKVVGSLKYDTADLSERVAGAQEMAGKLCLDQAGQRVLVAGSTGPGEEEMLLWAYRSLLNDSKYKGLRLVIVPRKPERFDGVARLIEQSGLGLVRWSQVKAGAAAACCKSSNDVVLGDTMGDLRGFYSLADLVFVGRSLVPMGGSDMIEAAALGKPVIVGGYTENFADTVRLLKEAGGICLVQGQEGVRKQIDNLLRDPEQAGRIAKAGRAVIAGQRGATVRTVAAIRELL